MYLQYNLNHLRELWLPSFCWVKSGSALCGASAQTGQIPNKPMMEQTDKEPRWFAFVALSGPGQLELHHGRPRDRDPAYRAC